jgi:dimethylargininase
MPLHAITREVSSNINRCELTFHDRVPIDLARAKAQHKAYQECLTSLGLRIISLPPEPDLPDSVFVEDAAVVLDEVAVIPIMGAPSRRDETKSLATELSKHRPIRYLMEPATLDGGDVLKVGRGLFVGLTRRTNQHAIDQLRKILEPFDYEVHSIEVRDILHLKSACSDLGENTVLVNRECFDAAPLRNFELIDVPKNEPGAANVLRVNDAVLMATSFPATAALLQKKGYNVRPVDVSELQKAEAGVTCCSVIFRL